MISKRGQVAIFIIIAIIIVAGVIVYFLVKDRTSYSNIPSEFQPVEDYFLSCIEDIVRNGKDVMGTQGGYIEPPNFDPGSDFMPFSSQLNFYGWPVPYWYYKSGVNIIKEQVPSKDDMEEELNKYIQDRVGDCDFGDFVVEGFIVEREEGVRVQTDIGVNQIFVNLNAPINVNRGEESVRIEEHEVQLDTKFGKFYDLAVDIYDYEKEEMFLENYAVDVLRLYAPVDGFEIQCSPLIWAFNEVVDEVKQGLSGNMQAIRLTGDYYDDSHDYFVQDLRSDEAVRFLYDPSWPTRIEVWPSDSGILIAEPVGTQEGLGILGFCYVPYHYVYDLNYPVLVQIYDEAELFQFPVAVIIDKNRPREALPATEVRDATTELCKYRNSRMEVYTYDTGLNPVEADISFKCISDSCYIGKTQISGSDAKLSENFPQCVNGHVVAKAEGYVNKKHQVSTNVDGQVVDIVLDKIYDIGLNLKLDGRDSDSMAVIYFQSEDYSATVSWPQQRSISLAQGDYNVTVYVYQNSSLKLEGYTTEKCTDVPREGLLGMFGLTTEKCFDISVPDQIVSMSLSGGGKTQEYIVDTNLRDYSVIEISVESMPKPTTLEELQDNYNLFEYKRVYVEYK
ncbi:MAG: hypothetical protein KKF56_03665 [Nanoarchaeota archaeon]|nr:hypothetical protein [Nanoarchaeota archaeon]